MNRFPARHIVATFFYLGWWLGCPRTLTCKKSILSASSAPLWLEKQADWAHPVQWVSSNNYNFLLPDAEILPQMRSFWSVRLGWWVGRRRMQLSQKIRAQSLQVGPPKRNVFVERGIIQLNGRKSRKSEPRGAWVGGGGFRRAWGGTLDIIRKLLNLRRGGLFADIPLIYPSTAIIRCMFVCLSSLISWSPIQQITEKPVLTEVSLLNLLYRIEIKLWYGWVVAARNYWTQGLRFESSLVKLSDFTVM